MYWFSSWRNSRYVNHYLCCIYINNKRVCKKLSSTRTELFQKTTFFRFNTEDVIVYIPQVHYLHDIILIVWSLWSLENCNYFQSLLVLTIAVCGLTVHMLPAPRLLTDWCNVSLCRRCTLYTPLYTVQLFARTIRDPLIICWPYTQTTRELHELLCPAHAMPLLSFCKSFTVSRHTANSQASIL